MREEAERVIQEYLRPLVETDGGRIELLDVQEKRVIVRLSGTCSGCPGQPYTLSRFIEPILKRALGNDIEVEARFAT